MIAEILSPNDTTEEVVERVEEYLACGVRLVWVIHPYFRTVTVHRPAADPVQFNRSQVLTGDPELTGFSCPVADFFR
jgi:Uma2 family endonuclease